MYDITFCEGNGCQRKEQCHRYRELLRYRADGDPNKRTYISMTKPDNPDKCTLFWCEKEGAKMEKINGIIVDGKVYVADPEYSHCRDCALGGFCNKVELKSDYHLCVIHGATKDNDFGFRYSPELTDKINKRYENN